MLRNLPLIFDCMYCSQKGKILQNVVAFSEYMNFTESPEEESTSHRPKILRAMVRLSNHHPKIPQKARNQNVIGTFGDYI